MTTQNTSTLTKDEIIEITNKAICEEFEFDAKEMVPEATLYEDLELDSLDAVDLVLVLEQAFAIKLRNQPEVKTVRTLEDVYNLIVEIQKSETK